MKKIDEKIETLYKLLENESDKNSNLYKVTTEVLEMISQEVSIMKNDISSLKETVGFINADVSELQDQLFEEVSVEDLEDISDDYIEVKCNNCGEKVYLEDDVIKNNDFIKCPNCGENLLSK